MSYKIKIDIQGQVAQRSIQLAAHMAVSRFSNELGDKEGLAHRIAQIAAEQAIEQFKTWCNGQLDMIQLDHEMRAEIIHLKPPFYVKEV